MKPDLKKKLDIGLSAVQQAAQLVKKIQKEISMNAIDKLDRSPVTVADFASQAVISHILRDSLGDICLVGEEDSNTLRNERSKNSLDLVSFYVNTIFPNTHVDTICDWIDFGNERPSKNYWTVDPIDGTKGFLRGDQYAVALAYVENGNIQIGILGCPNLLNATIPDDHCPGSLVFAVRNEGTFFLPLDHPIDLSSKKKLNVSGTRQSSDIIILRSFESAHTNVDKINAVADALSSKKEPIRMDSQAKYALLAGGAGDLILRLLSPTRPDYEEKIWDQAAGAIILEEAGGRISDLTGKPLDFTQGRTLKKNRGVLATNGLIHHHVLQTLKKFEEIN